ncbi:MAG: hypothetical protein ACRDVD_01885 [Acidimicrobiia bacterium]
MRRYRLLAGMAAGVIVFAGILSVSSGGTTTVLPPPVSLRGSAPETDVVATDGLEFVPAPVIDLAPAPPSSSVTTPPVNVPGTTSSADSPDQVDDHVTEESSVSADSADSVDSPDD